MEELKPCPFCGGRASYGYHDCANGEYTYCENCGVEVSGDADRWNRRVENITESTKNVLA